MSQNNEIQEGEIREGNKLIAEFLGKNKTFAVTGTFHGSIVYANTEGEARKVFHKYYNGESIIHIKVINN